MFAQRRRQVLLKPAIEAGQTGGVLEQRAECVAGVMV